MSGYKRVSFYELCRLCASNSQKEKTHIFQEDGRKIQLQSKIQTCLSLTVNENDFLPKVVCSKCLRNLETCYGFQQECVRSESMLSTYFKNFRHTEDFKRSGKVYIKDIKPQPPSPPVQQIPEITTSSNINAGTIPAANLTSSNLTPVTAIAAPNSNIITINKNHGQPIEQIPVYTLQLPTIVSNPNLSSIKNQKTEVIDNRLSSQIAQNQFAYNLNLINTTAIKANLPKNEMLSNVVVNANGEVINIAQMGDFETILNQGNIVKNKHKHMKRPKDRIDNCVQNDNIVKIDLTETNNVSPVYGINQKYDKLPHIKTTQQNLPSQYTFKLEEKSQTQNPTVIFPLSQYNQNFNNNFANNNTTYTQSDLNVASSSNTISTNSNVICNTSTNVDNPAININVLSQSMQDMTQVGFTNVISNVTSNTLSSSSESDNKINIHINTVTDNSNTSLANNNNTQPVKVHMCEICQRGFKRREHLYQHVKLHTGFRPYICENCSKAFMRKEHLLRHSTLHSGQKNFTCNICEKSFSRNDNLLKHKKTHEKQSSYVCEICQKHFVMKHYYNAHKLTHGDKCFVSSVWGMLKT
ncbi:hypothetical protein NQ315_013591 [Exocentrus adspersus]|uniref:Uncharacterized protein n=1 Tax=Exocentrus adspersus TaxID=1586481 RepID=A0AAV8W3B7_9CUCU|nr:hypothetical protein NQ315_013591 [Exocentrus adspersus]